MKIRKAKLTDLDYIIDCMYKLHIFENTINSNINQKGALKNEYKGEVAQEIIDNDFIILIGEENGSRIGILTGDNGRKPTFWHYKKISNLNYLYIEEKFRKKGYAEKLCEKFFKWAKKEGSDRVLLNVLSNNNTANTLYKKLGFEINTLSLGKNI